MNEILERYYTEKMVSKFLISKISTTTPNVILDLGVGNASLIKAAFKKWKDNTSYFGIDIDASAIQKNKDQLPYCNFICLDALKLNFLKNIRHLMLNVDVAICNPPYTIFNKENRDSFNKTFDFANLCSLKKIKNLSTESIFLAYNLAVLKEGGILGIILPDGILTNKTYGSLRNDLLKNHEITHIVELPEKVFNKTEAKTHILVIKKGKCSDTNYKVKVLKLMPNGKPSAVIKISSKRLVERMDYTFQKDRKLLLQGKSLKQLGILINRGKLSNALLKNQHLPYFHSTSFKHFDNEIHLETVNGSNRKDIANVGDLVMTRVGKRSVGRFGIITKGSIIVSDCVFILQIPDEIKVAFYKYIRTEKFTKILELLKHGVCSKVISKVDLENLKIEI